MVTSPGLTTPAFSGAVQAGTFAAFAVAGGQPGSGYTSWATTNAPTTGNDLGADEDGDGVPNGVEFLLGGGISTSDLDKLPRATRDGTDFTFRFDRSQQSLDPSLIVTIEVGSDLVTWPDAFPVPGAATAGPPVEVVKDTSPGFDTVTLSVPVGSEARQFARLRVVAAP